MNTSNEVCLERMRVKGKFLYQGSDKFYIKGVTYGTFAPEENGCQFPNPTTIEKDFKLMAEQGFNCIRTYTTPPLSLLNIAEAYQLKVMVGLPWEQHITFLDTNESQYDIIRRVKEAVQSCSKHSAILCYTIGNEIPASIVRWYGNAKIEKFLYKLYKAVKESDPESLVTYVNYPTTEYLDLRFLDFDCFNVYLETPEKLSKYIARLHNLSGDRPLVLAEIGLDSMRNGLDTQAETLVWQINSIFGKGCAGMFVFAWTDEWWRGGFSIEDWDFGLVDRLRNPKPALKAVRMAMANVPFSNHQALPFFSVIVCSYNGAATIRDTLEGLTRLSYPNFEVIVVNDGSKDKTADITKEYPSVKLISTSNKGLSNARNTGLYNAKGEIIAYIDDDAYPEEHWLHYLAYAYADGRFAAMGGPNIIPEEDGPVATCVANAPGGPVHVLSSDEIAEHIPGCNLSAKREVLLKIGGFDPVYRAAGDDVDICWRIQDAGFTIGFHPAALVWHHRRNSLKAYWKQQQGYGKAEALLEAKWPEKYNGFGHLSWAGRIYGNGFTLPINVKKGKVFHGTWGSALFQSVYQPADGLINCIPLMPEWYLVSLLLGFLSLLGITWSPLHLIWPFFIISFAVIVAQAISSTVKNSSLSPSRKSNYRYYLLIIVLHIIQPVARLKGRISNGLSPWRRRGAKADLKYLALWKPRILLYWSEAEWRSNENWLEQLEQNILKLNARVKRGGDFDKWDLSIYSGLFANAKGIMTVEEHGANKQYVKFRYRTSYSLPVIGLILFFTMITIFAAIDHYWIAATILSSLTIIMIVKFLLDASSVVNCIVTGFNNLSLPEEKENGLKVINFNSHHQPAGFNSPIQDEILQEIM